MKTIFVAALCLCSLTAVSAGETGHPIEKVIGLIKGLKSDAIEQGKKEEVAYGKFTYWCSTSISTLDKAIEEEKETISELTDLIDAKEKEKTELEKAMEKLKELIKELNVDQKNSDDRRKAANKLYNKNLKDTQDTIAAMKSAISALEGAETTTESLIAARKQVRQVVALISLKASVREIKSLQKFAGPHDDVEAKGDMKAHVDKYDFKSENVIELLKNLKLKFEDDETTLTTEETNSLNAYNLEEEARTNEINAAQKSYDKKDDNLGEVKLTLSDAKGNKKDEEDQLEADEATLKATEEQCQTKKEEWEARSKTRELEIEAMEAAIGILAKSTGVRTEAPENPIPPASPVKLFFLQLAATSNKPGDKAVALLKEAANEFHSQALERLAVEVDARVGHGQTPGKGHFDQVINMIEKMIFRLMDEQKQEDEHKHWCDQELEKTDTMISEKTAKIKDLSDKIDVQKGKVQKLGEDILAADEMIADIIAFMKESTEIRNIGKKENAEAVADSEKAQTSLADAIAVLTDFYKSSGQMKKEAWEFIQGVDPVKLPKNPATWESSYTGVADPENADTGIISILEHTMADFATMEADTKAQEETDQKEYEESMSKSEIEKAKRTQEQKMKTEEKARRVDKIASMESTKKSTEAELEKTQIYLKDLQPACVDTDGTASYEKRKAARSKEIGALKSAQDILTDAFKESFLQNSKGASLRGRQALSL